MPDYRTPACAFCDEPSVAPCGRCGCNACAAHGLERWCTLCERERVDERDFALATAKLRGATLIDTASSDRINSMHVGFNVVSLLLHAIARPYRAWRAGVHADRAFLTRSAEEIEAWRRANAPGARRR